MEVQQQNNKRTDWLLLVFMILFTNQLMLSVKIMAIAGIYVLRPNFRFGTGKDRLPKFYLLIMLLSAINFLFFIGDFSSGHFAAFVVGNMFWLFSFMAAHQIKLSIERYGTSSTHRLLKWFMVIHFLFCVGQLIKVMILAGTINPYRQSIPFPYGMSTGDNLYGTFLQGSYYNLVLSAMLAIYFLFRREMIYSLLACTCLVLIFGNFGTIVFTCLLAGLLFLGLINDITGRKVKLFRNLSPPPYYPVKIAGIVMYTIFLYIVVSPGNAKYISDKVKEKVYSVETGGKDDYRAIIANQKMDPMAFDMFNDKYLDEKMQNYSKETSLYFKAGTAQSEAAKGDEALKIRKEMTRNYIQMLQGKSLAVLETIEHLKSSSKVLLIGAGTGHFSSLTAQKIAGFDSSRLFMNILPHYISPEYANNHYLLIEERLKSSKELYSTANWPDSFYNQIASEYGLTGVLLFIIFYVGFFLKKINKLTYGFWIIILLIPFAHLSYIFDTICVMPYFELLLLLDIEDGKQRYAAAKV